jgi:hypothetical protein
MFGKKLADYVRFQSWILALIVVVGLARLGLSLGGVENASAKWLSITAVLLLGVLYYGVAVGMTGFGGYKQLYPLLLIQSVVGQLIIILGIVIGITTGHSNIFTAPEFGPPAGGGGMAWTHVLGHVVVGMGIFPLVFWAIASLVLLVTRALAGTPGARQPSH